MADRAHVRVEGAPDGDGGSLLAVKSVVSAAGTERLAREAEMLKRAGHPGVVELVSFVRTDDGAELRTVWAGGHSLRTYPSLPAPQAAGVVASLATTLADLHDLGVVHGRVEVSHVVVAAGSRPVLCGFAGSGPAGTPVPADAPGPDPAHGPGVALTPAADVFGLGTVLRHVVADVEAEPIPERRPRPRRRRRPWTGYDARSLLILADQATADDPARRPSARALAVSLQAAVPAAHLITDPPHPEHDPPLPPVPPPPPPAPARGHPIGSRPVPPRPPVAPATDRRGRDRDRHLRRAPVAVGVVLVGLACVSIGAWTLSGGERPSAPAPPTTAAPVARSEARTASTTSAPDIPGPSPEAAVALPARTCAPVPPEGAAADLDGDGCEEAVELGDGEVQAAGRRYQVGAPGDQILLGDWHCLGRATVGLVRPGTGEVFLFPDWAEADRDLVVRPAARIEGPVAAHAADVDDDGCDELVVRDEAGDVQPVSPVER